MVQIFSEKDRPLVALLASTFCCQHLSYVRGIYVSTNFLTFFLHSMSTLYIFAYELCGHKELMMLQLLKALNAYTKQTKESNL